MSRRTEQKLKTANELREEKGNERVLGVRVNLVLLLAALQLERATICVQQQQNEFGAHSIQIRC